MERPRNTWQAQSPVRISLDLVPYSQQLTVLLNAVDCYPNGGLYSGVYAVKAARRYEQLWLPLLASCATEESMHGMVPPLDIAFAQLVHRLNPTAYARDMEKILGRDASARLFSTRLYDTPLANIRCATYSQDQLAQLPGPFGFTNGSASERAGKHGYWVEQTITKWAARRYDATARKVAEPFFPPKPLTTLVKEYTANPTLYSAATQLSMDLVASMGRQGAFLHSLLRPCYLEAPFLQAAQQRYLCFLQLHKERPNNTLVPMMDIDLMWHTHMGIPGVYRKDCFAAFNNKLFSHDDGIEEGHRLSSFDETKATYEQRFPEAGEYNPPPTQLIPMSVRHPLEYYLGNLMQLFLAPHSRTSVQQMSRARSGAPSAYSWAAGSAAPGASAPPLRTAISLPATLAAPAAAAAAAAAPPHVSYAGGNAVYLAYFVAQCAAKVMGSKWNKLFKGEDKRKRNSIQKALRKGLDFSRFQRLPLGMCDEFWQQFRIRQGTAWGITSQQGGGMAMGVPANGAVPYSQGGSCPGCGRATSACRCATQCYSPYDLALLPVLLALADAEQRRWEQERAAKEARDMSAYSSNGYYGGYASNDALFLATMLCCATWEMDMAAAMCMDADVCSGWNDAGACGSWDGVNGFGNDGGAAACGSGAGGCGGGGGGCGGAGGDGGDGGGGGGGCGGGGCGGGGD